VILVTDCAMVEQRRPLAAIEIFYSSSVAQFLERIGVTPWLYGPNDPRAITSNLYAAFGEVGLSA
jgi:hypothetical protein